MSLEDEIAYLSASGMNKEFIELYKDVVFDLENGIGEEFYEKEFKDFLNQKFDGLSDKCDKLLASRDLDLIIAKHLVSHVAK